MQNAILILFFITSAISAQSQVVASYTYDNLHRLTQASYSNGVQLQYSYDELGNRTQTIQIAAPSQEQFICQGDSLVIGTSVYTQAGAYTDILLNGAGSDSIVNTILTVYPKYLINNTLTICLGDSVMVGTNSYSSAGMYTDSLQTVHGCDSIVQTTLSIISSEVQITAFIEGYFIQGSSPAAMVPARYDNLFASGSISLGSATDVTQMTVELWSSSGVLAHSASGMLDINGNLSVDFPCSVAGGSFWIALTSPNTLRTFSATEVVLDSSNFLNFANSLSSVYSDGSADPMATISSGLFGLRSGDINQDDFIDGTDYALFESEVVNSANGVFSLPSDLNGDTYVDGSDYPILDVNSAAGYYTQYPSFF